jgi:hypothetical protein
MTQEQKNTSECSSYIMHVCLVAREDGAWIMSYINTRETGEAPTNNWPCLMFMNDKDC